MTIKILICAISLILVSSAGCGKLEYTPGPEKPLGKIQYLLIRGAAGFSHSYDAVVTTDQGTFIIYATDLAVRNGEAILLDGNHLIQSTERGK